MANATLTDSDGITRYKRPLFVPDASFVKTSSTAKFIIPAGAVYRIGTLYCTLTTSAVVASRQLSLVIWDASDVIVWSAPCNTAQPASQTFTYANSPIASGVNLPLPIASLSVPIPSGFKVGFFVQTSDVGDAFSTCKAIFEDES